MTNVPSAMDVTAHTLDFVKVGTDLIQWLGYERINSEIFSSIMKLGEGIALHPNSNGQEVLKQLGETTSARSALQLVIPCAFGRFIIRNTLLCWMPTTEAVILQYHDLAYATNVLCDILLAAAEPKFIPLLGLLVKRIMRKAVDSIALHLMTNSSADLPKLPEVLETLGKHLVTESAFSGSIYTIRMIKSGDIFVHMEYCAADVLCWIYYHWSGLLEVVNKNAKIPDKDLRHQGQGRKLTVIIASNCDAIGGCYEPTHERGCISVRTSHDLSFTTEKSSFTTEATCGARLPNISAERSKLYDITERNPYAIGSKFSGSIRGTVEKGPSRSIVSTFYIPAITSILMQAGHSTGYANVLYG
jgi:hypothetical protein